MISIDTHLTILSGSDGDGIHRPLHGEGVHLTSFLASIKLGNIVNCLALLLNHAYIPEMVTLGSGGQLGLHAQKPHYLPCICLMIRRWFTARLFFSPSNSWFCFSNSLNYMLYFYKFIIYFYARLFVVPFIDLELTLSQLFCLVIYVFRPLSFPLGQTLL